MDATGSPDAVNAPPSRRRRRLRIAVLAAGAVLVLLILNHRTSSTARCAVCASARSKDEWGLGWNSCAGVALWSSEDVSESEAFRDLCDPGHRHEWRTDHTWERNGIGGTMACGGWSLGPFALEYELSPTLRDLVRREIAAGSLDRATALRLVAVPFVLQARFAPAETIPDAALLATAERILREHYTALGGDVEAEVRYRLRRMWDGSGRSDGTRCCEDSKR